MQSKHVKELHSNFLNFGKSDGDIKYMTLTDLLSLLKKNELEATILGIETQRLVLENIYECICGDNGDLQDLSMQCLPYITIQFSSEEMISLALKLCKHLQNDLPSKDEEKYNSILRSNIIKTNAIKCMCTANRLLLLRSDSNRPSVSDSPLLLPQTAFTDNKNDKADTKITQCRHENISRLIESLSSLLLNIIASKQQSMRIEFTKHNAKQRELLASNQYQIQNESLRICFEHYHEQILFALDILSTIIDHHGNAVSFIFDSATNVLLNLLSGAHHDYVSGESDSTHSNNKITENTKALESRKVNKRAIQCLGSLSRFLPNNELKTIIDTLCDTVTKCVQHKQYSTLKNLFDAINKISNDYKQSGAADKGLSYESQCKLCNKVLHVISNEDIREEIEVREYGLMALETLIKNSSSSHIISLFPQCLKVLSLGLKYDPNYETHQDSVHLDDDNQESKEDQQQNTGWTDDEDDDDSWGNNDDDSFDDNHAGVEIEANIDEDSAYFEKLDELNQNLDDDDDDSWKVRRATNKCLLAMIHALIVTERDFNPNMFREVKQNAMNELLLLLNSRCRERVKRIKINILETYNTLLLHLKQVYQKTEIYITLSSSVIHKICSEIADSEYLSDVLIDSRYKDPDVYRSFFAILSNIVMLWQYYMQGNDEKDKCPQFIPCIIPLCTSTIAQYKNERWNEAIASVFKCLSAIYNNPEYVQSIDTQQFIQNIFSLSTDIDNYCKSNDVMDAMFECMGIMSQYLDDEKQHILLQRCIDRLHKRGQQQNVVINSTAACLNALLSLKQSKNNRDTLQMGMELGDELMMNEATRLSGIKLSISCIKSLPEDVCMDQIYEQTAIQSIVGKLSSFLKQNALNVRFLSLRGLVLSYDKYPVLCKEFALSLSEIISLLKNLFDHSSYSLNESCHRLKNFLFVLIHLFGENSTVFEDNNNNVKRLFNVFVIPLLECVTHSNAIHPSLFPLWSALWRSIGLKLMKMMKEDELSFMKTLHDKLIGSNLILSTKAAKFQSCSCCASFFNSFLDRSALESFFMEFVGESKEAQDEDEDEDLDMEPAYSNTAAIAKEINHIVVSQLLLMNQNKDSNPRSVILRKYRQYVGDTYKELCACSESKTDTDGSATYISSCYLSTFITDCDGFMSAIGRLSTLQPQFTLNTLSKVIEGIGMMQKTEADLLSGDGLQKLIQFSEQFADQHFNESATVISHLLCNHIAQNETFSVIHKWLSIQKRRRLGMESLTSALITMNGISNELLFSQFCQLVHPQFVHNVILHINDKDLSVSLSALKNIKFLILSRIPAAVQSDDNISKLLFTLLNRTKTSTDYIEKISFGPITKLVDKSASVRCLAFEVIADIIEYNNKYITSELIYLSVDRLMEAMRSNDTNLVNYAIQSFQILIRSGRILSHHITKELIECIAKEIENCKGGQDGDTNSGNKMDSNQKEKLAHLLHFYAVIRKSISNVLSLDYVTSTWNAISSLMTQIQHNPSFLTRTPSMVYNENMEIGQPLLLSPSLRSGSVSALQRDNSLQYLEPLHTANDTLNHANTNTNNDVLDID